jgi:hypothetical protein
MRFCLVHEKRGLASFLCVEVNKGGGLPAAALDKRVIEVEGVKPLL